MAPLASCKPAALGALGIIYARAGQSEKAQGILNELHQQAAVSHVPSCQFIGINAVLGNNGEALEWLQECTTSATATFRI